MKFDAFVSFIWMFRTSGTSLLLHEIDSWLNEDFFFFDHNLFHKPIHGLIFYRESYCFTYNCQKFKFQFFLNTSFNHELNLTTNRKYLICWFRIKLSRFILVAARILFSKRSPKTSFQRLNFQYFLMKILWNFVEMWFFHMPTVRRK